jgi:hypothetical protein
MSCPGPRFALSSESEVAAVGFGDDDVVDAGFVATHGAIVVEFPELVAVAAVPLAGGVVPFVLEPHRHPVAAESPEALSQHVVEFAFPLGGVEFDYGRASGEELVAIAPVRVGSVGEADVVGVAGVPGVYGCLDFL